MLLALHLTENVLCFYVQRVGGIYRITRIGVAVIKPIGFPALVAGMEPTERVPVEVGADEPQDAPAVVAECF